MFFSKEMFAVVWVFFVIFYLPFVGSPQLEDEKVMKGLKLPVDLFHVHSPGQLSRVRPRTAKGTKAYFCERGGRGQGGTLPRPPDQRRHLFMSELKEKVVLRGGEKGRGGDGNAAGSFRTVFMSRPAASVPPPRTMAAVVCLGGKRVGVFVFRHFLKSNV